MNRKLPSIAVIAFAIVILIAGFSGCKRKSGTPSETGANESTSAKPTPRTQFERDLQFVRTGNFTYVWVFSRKDGKPFDKGDGDYLRTNAPQVLDWVSTDSGKRYIGGANFDLEKANWDLLKKRFIVEDYSAK